MTPAPRDGRPPSTEPVFIWQTPPAWLIPSATQDRITARSSAQRAMCGSQSETQIPARPWRAQVRREARRGAPYSPIAVTTRPKLGGSGCPARRLSSGLGSKRSMWLGPPSMKRKMTLRARAG